MFEKKRSASAPEGMTIEDSAEAAAREEITQESVALEKASAEEATPKPEKKKKKASAGRVLLAVIAIIVLIPVIVIAVGTGPTVFTYLQGYAQRSDGSYHFAKGYDYFLKNGAYTIPAYFRGQPVKIIDGSAFENNKNLRYLSFDDGIVTISSRAFAGCENLESVTFPRSVKGIYNEAFRDCTSLTEIVLPEDLEYLGENAFFGCVNLKTVTLSSKGGLFISYSNQIFHGCPSIETFICPEGSDHTFDAELGLLFNENRIIRYATGNKQSEVHLPNYSEILPYAFSDANNLTAVYIPKYVNVDRDAFADCQGITIYFEGEESSSYLRDGWNPEGLNVVYNYTMEE